MHDLIIIGGGPAGLTAAIYALRADKSVLILEKETFGGQITFSPKVENIPGFTSLSGNEFAEKLVDQALTQGADCELAEVLSVEGGKDREPFIVKTDMGDFEGRAVIIATGAKHRTLGLPREDEFIGNGISFCAVCDGAFFRDQVVVLLAGLVRKLTIFQDLPYLTGEKKLQEELFAKDNVEILTGVAVEEYLGDTAFSGVRIRDRESGKTQEFELSGLFVAVGLTPQNEPFKGLFSLNEYGYADVNEYCRTETPGVFVAGDCRSKRIRQVTTAAADGAVAALAACDYIDGR